GKKQMTKSEKDALATFLAKYEPEDEDERFRDQFEYSAETDKPNPMAWKSRVEQGDVAGFKKWLKQGGRIDEVSNEGMTPVDLAIEASQSSIVELLLDRGASLEETLTRAVDRSRWGILRLVLKWAKGKTLKIEPRIFAKALEECDDVAVIEGLLDVGASLEEKSPFSPLHSACTNSNPEIVKLLLDRGAKLSTSKTESPLSAAINSRRLETVKLLLDAGLNLYAVPPGKSKGQVNLETRLQAEMNKPNPNNKEIKALQYLIGDEIERNGPRAPIFFLEWKYYKVPA